MTSTAPIKVAFASGTDELNRALIERMRALFPELPLYVVSDFPPDEQDLRWIPYRVNRGLAENLARCRAALEGRPVRLAGVLLVPGVPFRRMRLMALLLAPAHFLAFNEHLNNFMLLRPTSLPAIFRHAAWRTRNLLRWTVRAIRGADWNMLAAYGAAQVAGALRPRWRRSDSAAPRALKDSPELCTLDGATPPDPATFAALARAFEQVPELFCATAKRRDSEVAPSIASLTYVLRGDRDCSVYSAAKLRALEPSPFPLPDLRALDLSYRAWQRGWPSVSGAGVTSASPPPQPAAAEYLAFLARTVANPKVFRRLWRDAVHELREQGNAAALRKAASIALSGGPATPPQYSEEAFLALTSGAVSVFAGRAPTGKPRLLIASPYLPFPLSHGGAVRMYNLMRLAARDFDQVLVVFTETAAPPPPEVLEICAEVVLVGRAGSHSQPSTGRPDAVEEFDSPAFHAALRETARRWRPAVAQLEFTQMAQYAQDCAPARTILVEHDVTFDLYQQMLLLEDNWEVRQQLKLWRSFEIDAWRRVSCIVTMSGKDHGLVGGTAGAGLAAALPNGVDLARFHPAASEPEPRRILFIGSFAHLPNLIAVEFFLNRVWPLLQGATLHIIAGARHEYFLEHYRDRVRIDFARPGVELEGFVSDVRPSYRRAAVVAVPLLVSAGTNIKVLEAMAMRKAIVSTLAGVNGLEVAPGEDFLLVEAPEEMAAAITQLFEDSARRRQIETAARQRVERDYGWEAIARRQAELYRQLGATPGGNVA